MLPLAFTSLGAPPRRSAALSEPTADAASSGALLRAQFPAYHTAAEIAGTLRELGNQPNLELRELHTGGSSDASRPRVHALQTVSDALLQPNRPRALLVGGEHPRELLPTEVLLQLAEMLGGRPPPHVSKGLQARVDALARSADVGVIPVLDAASRAAVERGDWCRRCNANGVDLNRNYDEHWGADGERSAGPRPFSEEPTALVRDFAREFAPTLFLSVHSGQRAMFSPCAAAAQFVVRAQFVGRAPRSRPPLRRTQVRVGRAAVGGDGRDGARRRRRPPRARRRRRVAVKGGRGARAARLRGGRRHLDGLGGEGAPRAVLVRIRDMGRHVGARRRL